MIPFGWIEKQLGEIGVVGAGNSAPQGDENFTGGVYPFFRTADVGRVHFGIINNSADLLNEKGKIGLKLFKKGTILFPKSGASTFLNHRVMMDVDGFVVSHLATITPNESIIFGKYLLYYLSTIDSKTLIQDQNYPSLNLPIISSINVKFPEDIEEQQRIVEKLDTLFADIEKEKQNAQQSLQKTKELFESELHKLFTENTDGWVEKVFERCIKPVTYTNKIQRKNFLGSGKFPIVSQEDTLINGYWNEDVDVFKIDQPVVIFGDHTKKIKYIDFDFVLGADGVKILVPIAEIIPKYFYYCLQSIKIRDLGYARHYRLLKEKTIKYPDLQAQKEIIEKLDALQEQTQELEQIYTQQIADLDELKQVILKKAFNGEL